MASKVIRTDTPAPDQVPPTEPLEPEGGVMGFWDHLEELRDRIMRVLLAVVLGMVVSAFFTERAIGLMIAPYGDTLGLLNPTDSIVVYFKVALMLGAILASPMITYQLFMFIIPGLTNKEKRWVLLALPGTTALFFIGLAFTWVFLLPAYVNFLSNFQSSIFRTLWTAESYINFVTAVLFWHAAAFETPLIFYVLARGGFVTAGQMITYWRQAIVGAAVVAAVITPTIDPVTMSVIGGILLALYVFSIALVFIAQRLAPVQRASR
jgi:sec-independent protein translocase protein TatC